MELNNVLINTKLEARNPKQIQNFNDLNYKRFEYLEHYNWNIVSNFDMDFEFNQKGGVVLKKYHRGSRNSSSKKTTVRIKQEETRNEKSFIHLRSADGEF